MGLWQRLRGAARRFLPLNTAFEEPLWREILGGAPSQAGEHVSWRTALRLTTALRCGLVIADGVATVPCKLMRRDAKTGKRTPATEHRLYKLFNRGPNDWQDALQFLETFTLRAVFTGNAYAFINRVRGEIFELIPLDPLAVEVEQLEDYRLVYRVTAKNGQQAEFPAEAIWHLRGPSWDGVRGLDIIDQAREAIGLAIATQTAHAKRFGQGINASGVYSVKGTLDDKQYALLKSWVDQNHAGALNSGKPMILDREAKWQPLALTGVDAQHLETRKHQIEEVCSAFGVMPIMVGHSDKAATYASAEQMFIQHQTGCIRPWHRRFEKSMNRWLLTEREIDEGLYFKFFDQELLRGAAKDRAEYYTKMVGIGAFTPNIVLELEDMDGYDDGDVHLLASGMTSLDAVQNPPAPAPASPSSGPAGRRDPQNIGRVLSAKNEQLIRDSRDNLITVLSALDEPPEDKTWQAP
jgi:HK97 family phage portal protein